MTNKKRLVNQMLKSGNKGYTYTEIIKELLKFKFGSNFKYDSSYRGYYSGAFSGTNPYMSNGAGDCGLYKRDGLYYAKYYDYTHQEKRANKLLVKNIERAVDKYYPDARKKAIFNAVRSYKRHISIIQRNALSDLIIN